MYASAFRTSSYGCDYCFLGWLWTPRRPGWSCPAEEASPVAHLVGKRWIGKQLLEVKVYSPSMKRVITNQVMTPRGMKRAPVFYLLSGMYGGDGDQWAHPASGARGFFKDKDVYVVNPLSLIHI